MESSGTQWSSDVNRIVPVVIIEGYNPMRGSGKNGIKSGLGCAEAGEPLKALMCTGWVISRDGGGGRGSVPTNRDSALAHQRHNEHAVISTPTPPLYPLTGERYALHLTTSFVENRKSGHDQSPVKIYLLPDSDESSNSLCVVWWIGCGHIKKSTGDHGRWSRPIECLGTIRKILETTTWH